MSYVELLSKIEQSRQSLLLDNNYGILLDIMKYDKYDHITNCCLPHIYNLLIKIVNNVTKAYQLSDDKLSIDYTRYKYYSALTNSRLNTLYRLMKCEDVGIYMHRCAGMSYLLFTRKYYPEHIEDLTNLKEGRPDYLTRIDRQGHEVKIVDDNRMCFTSPQFINFSEDENIVIFERIKRNKGACLQELINFGCIYIETIKFSDILNRRHSYRIDIKDSDFDSALKERYRILNDRKKQMTIDDAWK